MRVQRQTDGGLWIVFDDATGAPISGPHTQQLPGVPLAGKETSRPRVARPAPSFSDPLERFR